MVENAVATALPANASGRVEFVVYRQDVEARHVGALLAALEEAWVYAAEDDSARIHIEHVGEGSLVICLLLMAGVKAGLLPSYATYLSFIALLPEIGKLPKAINDAADAVRNIKEFGGWAKKRLLGVMGLPAVREEEIKAQVTAALSRVAEGAAVELRVTETNGLVHESKFYNVTDQTDRQHPAAHKAVHIPPPAPAARTTQQPAPPEQEEEKQTRATRGANEA